MVGRLLQLLQSLWKSNRFFRFSMIISVGLLFRNTVYMRLYRKWNKFPHGPNGVPIAGVLFYAWYIGSEKYHAYVLPSYGKIVSYPTVMQQVMLINDPEVARKIYSNPRSWNRLEPFLQNVSNTITFLNGDKWLKRRKNIHSNLIATINSEQVTKGSLTFLNNVIFPYLDENDKISDIRQILRPLTFNLVLYACVGKHIKSIDDKFFIEFNNLAGKFWANFRSRMFLSFLIGNGKIFKLLKPMFNLGKLGENIRKNMVELVVEYNNDGDNDNSDNRRKKCFRDYVRSEKILSEEELFSDITSLLFPSIDTTSNMLAFCVYLLCKYPEKQEFIYEKELKPVFGGRVNNIQLSQNILLKLPYFRAFIFETMRIYPTTFVSAVRYLDSGDEKEEAISIKISENEEYELNTNCVFSINSIGIGRNPKNWVKNEQNSAEKEVDMMDIHFEFWLDENGAFKANKALTIFSLGRRQCIGKQVAMRNMYVVLSALMLKYKFSVENHKKWKIPVENYALFAPGVCDINITKRKVSDGNNINLILSSAGYAAINGNYRWFAHCSAWCLYKEDVSYLMQNNIEVNLVYDQLRKLQAANANFRWRDNILKCWIISSWDKSAIYYAAPHLLDMHDNYIPNQDSWISVHGSLPAPCICLNLTQTTATATVFGLHSHSNNNTDTSSLQPLPESIERDNSLFDLSLTL